VSSDSTTAVRRPVAGAPAPATGEIAAPMSQRARMEILGAVMLTLFLSALDQTIVGTALPTIVTDLGGNQYYVWAVTVYLLTSTITGPMYGKLSDQFGRRPLMMIGVGIFLIGSLLCSLSSEMWHLILFRGIQGLGAGAIFPISLAIIGDLFSPRERGRYQGLFGAVFGISMILGPALGGFLTDSISWHWIFLVNIPIGLVALFVLWRLLPHTAHPDRTRSIDYLGAAVFAAAIVPFLIGLTNKQRSDWTDPAVGGLIGLGIVLAVVFVWIESRAAEPMVPLSLFRNRVVAASLAATGLITFGFFGGIIFIPRWFQFVLGSSATISGYQMLPMMLGVIGGSIGAGQIVSRTGRYKWLICGATLMAGLGLLALTFLQADTNIVVLWVGMFVAGLGIGPSMAVFTIIVQSAVAPAMMGAATSTLTFFRQVGGSIGLALAGTIFGSSLVSELPSQLEGAGVPQPIVDGFTSRGADAIASETTGVGVDLGAQILAAVPEQARALVEPYVGAIVEGIHGAFSVAIGHTMWLGVAAALAAGLILVVALPEIPLRTWREPPPVAE
jgi:EmrB/QacA subfamily drug resistance transporter